MSFKSQIGQDMWVAEYLNFKKDGYFIEVGAFNGLDISNTYYFEKDLGWKGICIEPGADNYTQLIKNRSCTCIKAAINDYNGLVQFDENWTVGKAGEGIDIWCITFEWLLREYDCPKVIDYISLDVEGYELKALSKFPFEYKVNCWTIEHNAHEGRGEMRDEIRELMRSKGYKLVESGYEFEDWYVNERIY